MNDKQRSPDRWNFWLAIGSGTIFLIAALYYGFLSTGSYYDDDIAHYLIARYSWTHPSLFWDTWGRPAFTILYAPASLLGFGAARAFSAVIALVTCLLAAQVAKLYGARAWWLAVPLTALQPELLRQAFAVSTELSGAFLLCAALLAYKKERWTLLGLLAGLIPLARYELLPVIAVLGIILLRKRAYAGLVLLVLPMATQNILNATAGGDAAGTPLPVRLRGRRAPEPGQVRLCGQQPVLLPARFAEDLRLGSRAADAVGRDPVARRTPAHDHRNGLRHSRRRVRRDRPQERPGVPPLRGDHLPHRRHPCRRRPRSPLAEIFVASELRALPGTRIPISTWPAFSSL